MINTLRQLAQAVQPGQTHMRTLAAKLGLSAPTSLRAMIQKAGGGTTPANGDQFIGLRQEAAWYIYSGSCGDPLVVYPTKHAVITSILVPANLNFTLSHIDRNGSELDYIVSGGSLPSSLNIFVGTEVEGSWTAQFSGDVFHAPPSINVVVHWRKP